MATLKNRNTGLPLPAGVPTNAGRGLLEVTRSGFSGTPQGNGMSAMTQPLIQQMPMGGAFDAFKARFGGQSLGAYNPFSNPVNQYANPYIPGAFPGLPQAPTTPTTPAPAGGGQLGGGNNPPGTQQGGEGGRDNSAGGPGRGQSPEDFANNFVNRNIAVRPDPITSAQLAGAVLNGGFPIGTVLNELAGGPLGSINDTVNFTPEQQAALKASIAADPQNAAGILSDAREAYANNQAEYGWASNPTQGAGLLSGGATTPSTPGMAVPAGSFPGVAQPVNPAGLQTLPTTGGLLSGKPSGGLLGAGGNTAANAAAGFSAKGAGLLSNGTATPSTPGMATPSAPAKAPAKAASAPSQKDIDAARAAAHAAVETPDLAGLDRQTRLEKQAELKAQHAAIDAAFNSSLAHLQKTGTLSASTLSQAGQLAKSGLGMQQGKKGVSGSQISGGRTVGNNPNDKSGRNAGAPRDAGAGGRLGGGV